MKRPSVALFFCLFLYLFGFTHSCASNYYLVENIQIGESRSSSDSFSLSFSINGEDFSFPHVRSSHVIEDRALRSSESASPRAIVTSNFVCSLSSVRSSLWASSSSSPSLAASNERTTTAAAAAGYNLRIRRDGSSSVFTGAILDHGEMKYMIKPAREINSGCLQDQPDLIHSDQMIAYFPVEYLPLSSMRSSVSSFASNDIIVSQKSRYSLEEETAEPNENEEYQSVSMMFRSTSSSAFDYAFPTVPKNCPAPVSISVGIVGQWSFRSLFSSDEDACNEIANVINIVSGIFEETVNTQLHLDFAIVMKDASNVGLFADEKWNARPCQTTTDQLTSFTSWASNNIDTSISQLFTACGDLSDLAWEGVQCSSVSQGAAVVNYSSSDLVIHSAAQSFGRNFGASQDNTGSIPSIMYEPVSKQSNLSLHFSRKSQLEMCSHLSTLRNCLVPRDCEVPSGELPSDSCAVECGAYAGICAEGSVCASDGSCVVNTTCTPWCEKYGYNCGPDGCGGHCGGQDIDLVTSKAVCVNGVLKVSRVNVLDIESHTQFMVNSERASYQVSAAKWDSNLHDKQLRNAAPCDWNNLLWVGTVTGHLNIQAEFAVAVQPSSLFNLANLISSDILDTTWICSEDQCVEGNCERYRLYISEQVTGFSCYSQSCSGDTNPFPDSDMDWSLMMCGFVGNYAINGHPLAPSPFEPPNLSQCYQRGNSTSHSTCTPRTCANLQLECGDSYDDGCGGVIDCGLCPLGSTCTDEGKCECTVLATCANFPGQCGSIWDGCKYIDCSCPGAGATCTATEYEPGYCICNTTTDCLGRECGTFINDCGLEINCGSCASNYTCTVGGQCECTISSCPEGQFCFVPNGCGGDLYCPPPSKCASEDTDGTGFNCGVYTDDCGKDQYCGDCTNDKDICVNNVCTCIPKLTCLNQNFGCGTFVDDCGVEQDCGGCNVGEVCAISIDGDQSCICDPSFFCGLEGASCGYVNSTCGYEDCGTCDPGFYCNSSTLTCDDLSTSTCVPNPNACDSVECGVVDNGCEWVICENTCRVPSEFCSINHCFCNPINECATRECGVVTNGCDNVTFSCGTCSEYGENYVCSEDGQCECTPITCEGLQNGVYNDGCGDVLLCGGSDVPPCTPRNCSTFGNPECGQYDDGCGGSFSCGSGCGDYEVCYSGVCTCNPGTCDRFAAECSVIDDGCGNSIDCGSCSSPYVCENSKCVCNPIEDVCAGRCGVVFNGCEYVDCTYCLEPFTCILDQTVGVTTCVNASCSAGQVWSSKDKACTCPYGHTYDSVSEQCVIIPDDLVDVCFSESWSIVTGRWLTQARAPVGDEDAYTCSTIISAQSLNNLESRATTAGGLYPLELRPYMFANLDVRGEPTTFTFQTSFEWDVRSTFFGIASLIVDTDGTYVYFVWNQNTRYWELGLTNLSGSRAGVIRPGFASPTQRTFSTMTLQVYRSVTPCALNAPYVGWSFIVSVGDQVAGPYCFNEVPSHLIDSLFNPSDSLPFALLDDGNTKFISPTFSTVSQVTTTLWGCIDADVAQAAISGALSIPEDAVSVITIEQSENCPSPFGQKTKIVFQIQGGQYGTSSGLTAAFVNLLANNLFPFPVHPDFPPVQSAVVSTESHFQIPINPVTFTYAVDPFLDPDEVNPPTYSSAPLTVIPSISSVLLMTFLHYLLF